MQKLSTCPRCMRMITLPEFSDAATRVRCPLCYGEYALHEALALVPPVLTVVSAASSVTSPAAVAFTLGKATTVANGHSANAPLPSHDAIIAPTTKEIPTGEKIAPLDNHDDEIALAGKSEEIDDFQDIWEEESSAKTVVKKSDPPEGETRKEETQAGEASAEPFFGEFSPPFADSTLPAESTPPDSTRSAETPSESVSEEASPAGSPLDFTLDFEESLADAESQSEEDAGSDGLPDEALSGMNFSTDPDKSPMEKASDGNLSQDRVAQISKPTTPAKPIVIRPRRKKKSILRRLIEIALSLSIAIVAAFYGIWWIRGESAGLPRWGLPFLPEGKQTAKIPAKPVSPKVETTPSSNSSTPETREPKPNPAANPSENGTPETKTESVEKKEPAPAIDTTAKSDVAEKTPVPVANESGDKNEPPVKNEPDNLNEPMVKNVPDAKNEPTVKNEPEEKSETVIKNENAVTNEPPANGETTEKKESQTEPAPVDNTNPPANPEAIQSPAKAEDQKAPSQFGLRSRPLVTTSEFDKAIERATEVFLIQAKGEINAESYAELCRLAEGRAYITAHMLSPRQEKPVEELLVNIAKDPKNIAVIGRLAAEAMKNPGEKPGGLLFAGKAKTIKSKNGMHGAVFELVGGGGTISLLSDKPFVFKAEEEVFAMGAMIAHPTENIVGYTGKAPLVIWLGTSVPIPTAEEKK